MNTNSKFRGESLQRHARLFQQALVISAYWLLASPAAGQTPEAEWHCKGPNVVMVPDHVEPVFAPASGGFTIVVTFDATVPAAHRPVIQFAINEWDAVLQSRGVNPANYPITVRYGAPSDGALATTTTTFGIPSGNLRSAVMVVDPNQTWYVDPNPADDDEFSANPPPAGFDLLSVVRHELGHALGWLGAGNGRIDPLLSGNVFDPVRLNIALTADGHADANAHPGELMQPRIGTRTRRGIAAYPTVALVSRAFEYQMAMHFVDPAFSGSPIGSAWRPWRSFQEAMNNAPAGVPLLLAPTSFTVPAGATFSASHTVLSARGGATIR